MVKLAVKLTLVACAGCVSAPKGVVTRGVDDQEEMHSLIAKRIPAGTPRAAAQEFLEQEGFQCRLRDRERADREGGATRVLWGDRHDSVGTWVSRRWQVTIVLEDERTAEVKVTTGLVGP